MYMYMIINAQNKNKWLTDIWGQDQDWRCSKIKRDSCFLYTV